MKKRHFYRYFRRDRGELVATFGFRLLTAEEAKLGSTPEGQWRRCSRYGGPTRAR